MRFKKLISAFLAAAFCVSLAGMAFAEKLTKVPTAWMDEHETFLIWYAKEKGWDKEAGLDIDIQYFGSGMDILNALPSGSWVFAGMGGVPAMMGNLRYGTSVIAIGNPMGLEFQGSVTSGVVSALNRTLGDGDARIKLLQTDAAINPGNSGGALVNMDGKVIGINSAKIVANGVEGIGLAIPSNAVQNIISAIMEKGYVPRPYLGVSIFDQQSAARYGYQLNLKKGVYLFQVVPGGPADKAGLRKGDVITAIDGAEIKGVSDLRAKIAEHNVGDKVELTIQRGNQERKASLTLEEMPKDNN